MNTYRLRSSESWARKMFARKPWHVGLSGRPDHEIWKYAFENDFCVVTINARDFIKLLDVEVHPGLVVLRESGLSRKEQWDHLFRLVKHLRAHGDDNALLNKLVEITAVGHWVIREIPKP